MRSTPIRRPVTWAAACLTLGLGLGLSGIADASSRASTLVHASSPSPAPTLTSITPCRLVDTRAASVVGPRSSPLGPGETYTAAARGTNGNCTLPVEAVGIVANVTIADGTAASFLTVYPSDATRPTASNLNWSAGQAATPNQVTVGLSATGQISLYNFAGSVDVIVDVVGYLRDHNHDDLYPARIFAVVNGAGNLVRGPHAVAVNHPAVGEYRVIFDRDVSACAPTSIVELGLPVIFPPSGTPDPNSVYLETLDYLGSAANRPFDLVVTC